jgi:hypothetical protein
MCWLQKWKGFRLIAVTAFRCRPDGKAASFPSHEIAITDSRLNVGALVGYGPDAAFSKAFRRVLVWHPGSIHEAPAVDPDEVAGFDHNRSTGIVHVSHEGLRVSRATDSTSESASCSGLSKIPVGGVGSSSPGRYRSGSISIKV